MAKKKKAKISPNLEVVKKEIWPKTKKELEKAMQKAKAALKKGESYIKALSEKSAQKTEELSLKIKKEKLVYDLGKTLISTSKTKWADSKKISSLIAEIKKIDRALKSPKSKN